MRKCKQYFIEVIRKFQLSSQLANVKMYAILQLENRAIVKLESTKMQVRLIWKIHKSKQYFS